MVGRESDGVADASERHATELAGSCANSLADDIAVATTTGGLLGTHEPGVSLMPFVSAATGELPYEHGGGDWLKFSNGR